MVAMETWPGCTTDYNTQRSQAVVPCCPCRHLASPSPGGRGCVMTDSGQ